MIKQTLRWSETPREILLYHLDLMAEVRGIEKGDEFTLISVGPYTGTYAELHRFFDLNPSREEMDQFAINSQLEHGVTDESLNRPMHPIKVIEEWRKGCSNTIIRDGEYIHPSNCEECTEAAMKAIEKWFNK